MTRRVGEPWQPDWHKVLAEDGLTARVLNGQGEVMEVEYYEFTGEECSGDPLVNVRVESAAGDLIARHVCHRISDTACDIHVLDAEGTLRVILHHSDIDKGEPVTIREEWLEG